jgi:hypothetical protein
MYLENDATLVRGPRGDPGYTGSSTLAMKILPRRRNAKRRERQRVLSGLIKKGANPPIYPLIRCLPEVALRLIVEELTCCFSRPE